MDRNEKRILFIAVGLMLLFFLGLAYAYRSYGVTIPDCVTDVEPFDEGRIVQRGEKDFEVQMVARMWTFEPKEVVLPPGSHVTLYLSTRDVVHGMQILGTNVNLMAVPGSVNYAEVTFEEEGEYLVICHEYCGRNHQSMSGRFIIREGATLEPPTPEVAEGPGTVPIHEPFEDHDCLACHTLDGTDEDIAPSFLNLFGRSRRLEDGSTVTADEAYLLEAIVDPEKQVVEGYDPMPEADVTTEQAQAMVDAIRALSEGEDAAAPQRSMEELFDEYDCTGCHTLDGSDEEMAPSFKGLFGTTRTLADGSTVTADEAYLRDAIAEPEEQVVEGYDPMPEMDEIPAADVEAMLDALRELGN